MAHLFSKEGAKGINVDEIFLEPEMRLLTMGLFLLLMLRFYPRGMIPEK